MATVYKDECAFCFWSPSKPGGVYVCLQSHYCFCRRHLALHVEKTKSLEYLHYTKIWKPKDREAPAEPDQKIAKLAIGVSGGLQLPTPPEFIESWAVAIYPKLQDLPITDPTVSQQLLSKCEFIIQADSAKLRQELNSGWDGSARFPSKFSDTLTQTDNPRQLPETGWACEHDGCGLQENLWLNLSDGKIFCGREQVGGLKGHGHALMHYQQTKYPLAVKLGSLSAGTADVYSYEEDEMVEDTNLSQHLKHFGVDQEKMRRTEKTFAELEMDQNLKYEWSAVTESGAKLEPVFGPGRVGIINMGSSCYISSSLQLLLQIPEFRRCYVEGAEEIFRRSVGNPYESIPVQTAKVFSALMSADYSKDPAGSPEIEAENGIRPEIFRNLLGRGHPDFSSMKQQDAGEYLRFLFEKVEQNLTGGSNPVDAFKFQIEERVCNTITKKVRYSPVDQSILSLPVDVGLAVNSDEARESAELVAEIRASGNQIPEDMVLIKPKIPLELLIAKLLSSEEVGSFDRTSRMATFPDFLLMEVMKFAFVGGQPAKLDVEMLVPDSLDLSLYRGKGPQPGEDLEGNEEELPADPVLETVVETLKEFGYSANASRRAVVKSGNQGLEAATNWLLEHDGDPDFNDPIERVVLQSGESAQQAEMISTLVEMYGGHFTEGRVRTALKENHNNMEAAADWLISHPDCPETPAGTEPPKATPKQKFKDGVGQYKLIGFITHLGTSTHCGHYVCHLLKDGNWLIFNDEKVAISALPPREYGYIYLYERAGR